MHGSVGSAASIQLQGAFGGLCCAKRRVSEPHAAHLPPLQGASGGEDSSGEGGTGGTGTYGTLSRFQLLEESGPLGGDGTQPLAPSDAMSHSTLALIGWVAGLCSATRG